MDQHVNEAQQIPVENYGEQDEPHIFMLNYDCFMNIFAYLDLVDLYLVAQTCKYFGNLAHDQLKHHKTLDTAIILYHGRCRHLIDYSCVIKQIGHFLNTLIWRFNLPGLTLSQLISLIPQYCPGIRHLEVQVCGNREILRKMFEIVKPLESLALRDCHFSDDIGEQLKFGINLQNIHFSYNPDITGKCLIDLVNIESLNLFQCYNIRGIYFNQILKNNKNLKYLNVLGCMNLQADNFQNMSKHCEELIHLVMSNSFDIDNQHLNVVAKIPKLKNLEIYHTLLERPFLIDSLFRELACVNKLEVLKIYGDILTFSALCDLARFTSLKTLVLYSSSSLDDIAVNLLNNNIALDGLHIGECHKISNQGLWGFIKKCPNLAFLHVVRCNQINLQFFFDVHSYLTSGKSVSSSRETANVTIFLNLENFAKFKYLECGGSVKEVYEFLKPLENELERPTSIVPDSLHLHFK